jgi:glycerol-3-phosphate dehydrogenase
MRDYDLIIIGGGINGAGIARDAAARGLRTLLLEAEDFGGGTSSWSSRLIHGGLRYLEYGEIGLVYESLHERRNLLRTAPHLVKPLRLTIPIFRQNKRGRLLVRLGMLGYDALSWGKALPGHDMVSRSDLLAAEPGIDSRDLLGGASYYDAQAMFPERLVIENVIDAEALGAQVHNRARVERLLIEGARVTGVEWRDGRTGARRTHSARAVVNAAGPWVDRVLAGAPTPFPRLMGGTKGSHLVTGHFSGAPADAFYIESPVDGRPLFVIPWNGQYLIGTTDIRFDGDPRAVQASGEEIDYLMGAVNATFPAADLTRARVHYTYCGVRPLPHVGDEPAGAITRRHIIRHHEASASGLFSIIGGKLTTYRSLAEQTIDAVARYLGDKLPACVTATRPLPGADGLHIDADDPLSLAAQIAAQVDDLDWRDAPLGARSKDRLINLYGSRAADVAAIAAREPSLAGIVCERTSAIGAEIVHAFEHEHAASFADVMLRRCMLGLNPDLGDAAAPGALDAAAAALGWSPERRERTASEYRDAVAPMRVRGRPAA